MELQSLKNRFGIIGNSAALNYALSIAERVASTNLSVLISGESGVGKEIFSQIIHSLSTRKHNSFIAVNCGAIPEGTIDSELFGHEKGSFTGATDARKGYFETVNGGTIFLDEIGEMPLGTQARLLRVLESGEYIRVGSSKTQKTDVRVVAATNVNLLNKVAQGKFREDLYYRLNTVPIKVPSLRERPEDIYSLFRKFSIDFSEQYRTEPIQLDDSAKSLLVSYAWPGNIRELKNVSEQISVLSRSKIMSDIELREFLPQPMTSVLPALSNTSDLGSQANTGFHEREILYKVLFDMKKDLNDLKKITFELMHLNNLPPETIATMMQNNNTDFTNNKDQNKSTPNTLIINTPNTMENKPVNMEESLSLEDMEKIMITKSLIKYKGRRREAAEELGISDRTLYRKINQYNLNL